MFGRYAQEPQGKKRPFALLAQSIRLQTAVLVTRLGDHRSHLQEIDRHQSRTP